MIEKIRLFRTLWSVIRNKEVGWVFFNLDKQQQLDILNNKETDCLIRFTEVDPRVIEKITKRIEGGRNDNSNIY